MWQKRDSDQPSALELFSSHCYFDFVGPYLDSKKFLWSEEILRLNQRVSLNSHDCQTRLRTHRTHRTTILAALDDAAALSGRVARSKHPRPCAEMTRSNKITEWSLVELSTLSEIALINHFL
jgi:hypothetical protein